MRIRLADPARDAERAAEIYRPSVDGSYVSFDEVAPDAAEMAERMRTTLVRTPWLVAESDDREVVGYAYASEHRQRAGYRWSVDISAYVDADWHRRGVGKALYMELLALLRRQGFVNVYAGIALPNDASVRLHEAIGMSLIGVYERVGFKLGAWRDVAWYGMRLTADSGGTPAEPSGDPPAEPVPLPDLELD
jgi:phosphinothricin acetyltransferase